MVLGASVKNINIELSLKSLYLILGLILVTSCKSSSSSTNSAIINSDPAAQMSEAEILEKYSGLSCDPFGNNSNLSTSVVTDLPDVVSDNGLKATVRVSTLSRLGYSSSSNVDIDDFLVTGKADALDYPVFFSQINVPTRLFSLGFPTVDGDKIRDLNGNIVDEYFHITYEGYLRLAPPIATGTYQFAVIGDDGIRLSLNNEVLLETPFVTPSYLSCSDSVEINDRGYQDFLFEYFQGPKYHIASVLLWRNTNLESEEILCDHSGNNKFFVDHELENPTPTTYYLDLLDRGWSVVPPQVLYVNQGHSAITASIDENFNPCLSPRVLEVLSSH